MSAFFIMLNQLQVVFIYRVSKYKISRFRALTGNLSVCILYMWINFVCVCRCVYSAAVWYYNHLAGMKDIVMITEDQEAVAQYSSLNSGVYVISVQVHGTPVHYCSHHVRLILFWLQHTGMTISDEVQVPTFSFSLSAFTSILDEHSRDCSPVIVLLHCSKTPHPVLMWTPSNTLKLEKQ